MKKTTVVSCLTLALLLSSAAVTASAGEAEGVSGQREAALNAKFAAQDKRLEEAKAHEEKKEYDEAIQILQSVADELSADSKQIESWKIKQRLRAILIRKEELCRKSGELKLNQAKEAFAAGNYTDAIAFATAAATVCPGLQTKAEFWKNAAIQRKRNAKRATEMAAATADPQIDSTETAIVRELAMARTLIKNKRYEEARRHIEQVYKMNPFNPEAAYLAGEIYKKFYQAGYRRRQADMEMMKADEAWQWVEPVFLRDTSANDVPEGVVENASDQGINAKLDKIIIPKVRWDEFEIIAVIDYLNRASKINDPEKEGVIIAYDAGAPTKAKKSSAETGIPENAPGLEGGNPLPEEPQDPAAQQDAADGAVQADIQVSLSVDNVSLRELLDYISFLTDLHYTVLPDRVIIGNGGSELKKQDFDITTDAVNRIINYRNALGGGETSEETASSDTVGTGDAGSEEGSLTAGKATMPPLSRADLMKFFQIYGIDFDAPNSAISYNRRGKLTMTNTPENINRMGDVLRLINTPKPMVRVEVKSIEISDIDMQQLGFEWTLGTLRSTNGGSRITSGSVGSDAVVGGATSMLRTALSGVDSKLVSNLNIFPDLFGSVKPFGSDNELNLSLTIDALDRSDRTETISAPTVTVANGMTGSVFLGKSYYFPEDWDELEIEMDSGGESSSWNFTITRPTPEFGDATDIGTTFTVTPNVKNDNYTIALAIHPKIVAYLGPENYEMTVYVKQTGEKEEAYETFNIWRPILSYRELDLKVNVYDGETLVLGALADSKAGSRLDKVPILGDIPLLGRLFQSHSETSTRKNMLIFVTARLVNDAGLPIRRLEFNGGGIPEANR